jgi:hypothetical protein
MKNHARPREIPDGARWFFDPVGSFQIAANRRQNPIVCSTYTNSPVMAMTVPVTPAITPITGNIFLREMK